MVLRPCHWGAPEPFPHQRLLHHAKRQGIRFMKLLAGNSNPTLTKRIAEYLGIELSDVSVRRFADQEIFIEVHENVRGEDVFVVQPTSYPANDHLMELLILIDALRRASARRITAVIPYFGYARQDRKPGPRTPISAKLVANLISHAGADRVLTLDLHAAQIQGFFDIPTDNLYAAPVLSRDILERNEVEDVMVVSPDVGGVVRARALAKRIGAPLAIVDKRRERAGESEVMNIIGDVSGRNCVLVDDIIDSGGTLCNAAEALMNKGCGIGYRLYHPRGAVRWGCRPHHRLQAARTGDHRFHHADRGHPQRPQHPRPQRRQPSGRSHLAHGQRTVGLFPV